MGRIYQPMERRENQGGGGAEKAEGKAGKEEGNQSRARKGSCYEEEGRGGKDQNGRGRNQETRNDGSSERKGWEVFRSCNGCSQRTLKVQGTSRGGMQNLLEHPHQTHSFR